MISQLAAIESACAEITAVDPRPELKAAFDLLRDRIAETDGGEGAVSQPAAARPAAATEAPTVAEAAPVVAEAAPEVAEAAATVASEPPAAASEMPEPVAAAPAPEAMVAPEVLSETIEMAGGQRADRRDRHRRVRREPSCDRRGAGRAGCHQ